MSPTSRSPLAVSIASLVVLLCGCSCARGQATGAPRYRIEWATFLGGDQWDQAREVIVYPDGSVLVGAQSNSVGMPVSEGAVQPRYAGDDPALGHGGIYGGDCYLARLSPDGRRVLAATYFGGSKQERNTYGMGLDSQGNVVICSGTRSSDMPTTKGCFQAKYGGGATDWFAAKLSASLKQLLWCTYIGGSGDGMPRGGLAIDTDDSVYVVGTTASPNFPTTPGVIQTRLNGQRDAAIAKLSPDGSKLVWATLLGGSGVDGTPMGVRLDSEGSVYGAGHTQSADFPVTAGAPQPRYGGKSDCFVVKLSVDASRLLHSTYLGGSENEFAEHRPYLAQDGSLLVPGVSASPDFPTTPGAFQRRLNGRNDAFLVKLSPDGKRFVFSTLIGGSAGEFCLMPTPDAEGNIFIVGQTESRDLPVTTGALQESYGGGASDGWLAILSPDGSRMLYCTYLGGSGDDMVRSVALGPNGEVYLVGHTGSADFPVTAGAAQTKYRGKGDAYLVKLIPER
jgi:hypothetical protein